MRRHRYLSFLLAAIAAVCQSAEAVTIDTVPIGNPGNPADIRYDPTGSGAVGYSYRIGKTEVTNAQYVEFLNGVDPSGANTLALWSSSMSTNANGGINFNGSATNGSKYEIKLGRENNPVVFVSWYDAIRFANWLHNGQGNGDTENGAYTLLGGSPTPSDGNDITRNPDARWWLPNDDEWYKAAYHKNDGLTSNYWDYPTSTNAVLYSDQPPGSDAPDPLITANFYKNDNIANGYNDGYAVTGSTPFDSSQNYLTDVGAYLFSRSPYGTFDQGGNVWEWNETLFSGTFRILRGSSWANDGSSDMRAALRFISDPTREFEFRGFRVATIPEPASITLCLAGVLMLVLKRTRR